MKIKKRTLFATAVLGIGVVLYQKKKTKSVQKVPQPVDSVELAEYLGQWYEIARLPNYFQDEKSYNTSAHYGLNSDQTIAVTNRCIDKKGRHKTARGTAFVQNEANSQLKVSFLPKYLQWFPCSKGDYWILRIDENYETALVGDGKHKYLWLLARTPRITEEKCQAFLATAKEQGYDTSSLIFGEHR
ncbi:lipocalin family protein [Acinetobacter sp. B5B]|uniref:lipocalin family protein n=1 Tax=Acinetobacter baretiae TaxID=2605383 RepID=UPI0018C21730|nr:lipocalin family protein [Acinetobacter baretiae]MBF7682508.1 lipocalin family protein [Acinetobacter baretiae]MBF7685225.1 lipocalin family protein [Acinetobacter baretiae]